MVRKRNDFKRFRQDTAAGRKNLRDARTNEEQIQHILARGGDPKCAEVTRLSK